MNYEIITNKESLQVPPSQDRIDLDRLWLGLSEGDAPGDRKASLLLIMERVGQVRRFAGDDGALGFKTLNKVIGYSVGSALDGDTSCMGRIFHQAVTDMRDVHRRSYDCPLAGDFLMGAVENIESATALFNEFAQRQRDKAIRADITGHLFQLEQTRRGLVEDAFSAVAARHEDAVENPGNWPEQARMSVRLFRICKRNGDPEGYDVAKLVNAIPEELMERVSAKDISDAYELTYGDMQALAAGPGKMAAMVRIADLDRRYREAFAQPNEGELMFRQIVEVEAAERFTGGERHLGFETLRYIMTTCSISAARGDFEKEGSLYLQAAEALNRVHGKTQAYPGASRCLIDAAESIEYVQGKVTQQVSLAEDKKLPAYLQRLEMARVTLAKNALAIIADRNQPEGRDSLKTFGKATAALRLYEMHLRLGDAQHDDVVRIRPSVVEAYWLNLPEPSPPGASAVYIRQERPGNGSPANCSI